MRDLIQAIKENENVILCTYDALHKLAEPSWKEEKTSRYLQKVLYDAGFSIQTFAGHYGFIAELQGEKREVIALRADMDALMQEIDGEVRANHACGHDAHSTMVLHAALALKQSGRCFRHTVRFIFQPAEEVAEGALQMVRDGVLENVKFLGGIHLRPELEVPFQKAAPVIQHGSSVSIKGVITGKTAHAARPELGINALEAASALIQAISQIRLQAQGSYSIKITELQGGEASNSIPEKARFTFDLRSENNETMDLLIKKAKRVVESIAALTETNIAFSLEEYAPAAVTNDAAIAVSTEAIATVLGKENVNSYCKSPGAEDFHFYTMKKTDIAATMIGLGCGLQPGLHHPAMTFNKEALIFGTQILAQTLLFADKKQW
ncbi:amidohydrolase [Bacillus sp. AGMB 02131]|uniref:Amidohydrolase n=1 Tax=Peribacillus faecalis TaxID=2772559 RepID=A0A927D2V6_9BACI|nr:amidohydrolase [Peribacillus faecalis]MBD3110069.1 amidohydrolase [Peribacillus faecalis]